MTTIRQIKTPKRRTENALACILTISMQLAIVAMMSTVVWRHIDKLGF